MNKTKLKKGKKRLNTNGMKGLYDRMIKNMTNSDFMPKVKEKHSNSE
jgi:hypothetical protein